MCSNSSHQFLFSRSFLFSFFWGNSRIVVSLSKFAPKMKDTQRISVPTPLLFPCFQFQWVQTAPSRLYRKMAWTAHDHTLFFSELDAKLSSHLLHAFILPTREIVPSSSSLHRTITGTGNKKPSFGRQWREIELHYLVLKLKEHKSSFYRMAKTPERLNAFRLSHRFVFWS